jgi:hypothetical protein
MLVRTASDVQYSHADIAFSCRLMSSVFVVNIVRHCTYTRFVVLRVGVHCSRVGQSAIAFQFVQPGTRRSVQK